MDSSVACRAWGYSEFPTVSDNCACPLSKTTQGLSGLGTLFGGHKTFVLLGYALHG